MCAHSANGVVEELIVTMAEKSQPAPSFTRNRSVVIAAALVAMLLAAAGGWLAINAMSNEAARSNLLPIRSVTFAGELVRVDRDALKSVAGGIEAIGGSMLRTDLNQVKAVVKQIEWVRDAEIRRRFPATLEIQIEEYKPFARWQISGAASESESKYLVSTQGEVFEADTDDKLPLLSGPADASHEMVVQWMAFAKQLEPVGRTMSELRLSPRRAWHLTLDNGSTLSLGRNDASARLARYVNAYSRIPVLHAANTRIDLRYQTGLAVRAAFVLPSETDKTIKAVKKPKRK